MEFNATIGLPWFAAQVLAGSREAIHKQQLRTEMGSAENGCPGFEIRFQNSVFRQSVWLCFPNRAEVVGHSA